MKVLVRTIFEFKDDTFEVHSFEEILAIIDSIKDYDKFNIIIYKMGLNPNFLALRLQKNIQTCRLNILIIFIKI